MNVGKLRELLEGVDDSLEVLIPVNQEFDGRFYTPCEVDSGESEIGGDETMTQEEVEHQENLGILKTEKVFMLLPCGFDEESDHSHELN